MVYFLVIKSGIDFFGFVYCLEGGRISVLECCVFGKNFVGVEWVFVLLVSGLFGCWNWVLFFYLD